MKKIPLLQMAFWIALLAFLIWDWANSKAVNPLLEPAPIALGSGQKSLGGHCSNASK
jgi:hypothetical protein